MTKKPQMSLVPSADAGKSADGCQLSHSHMETHLNQINAVADSSSLLPPHSPVLGIFKKHRGSFL